MHTRTRNPHPLRPQNHRLSINAESRICRTTELKLVGMPVMTGGWMDWR